jgi:hypothetical protein
MFAFQQILMIFKRTKIMTGSKDRKHRGGVNKTLKPINTLTTGLDLGGGGGGGVSTKSVPKKTLKV